MPFRLQQRRDTAANWTSNNPTLAAGEIGIETNTSRFKIGDGTTAWNSLTYAGGGTITSLVAGTGLTGGTITATGTIAIDTAVTVDKTTTQTLTNKTLTSPQISGSVSGSVFLSGSSTATGIVTIPNGTETLVGRATTDTLTNKTLTSPVISSIVNSGTLTLPTGTDTLIGRASTDTLTNKTISAGVLTGTVTAGGGVGTNGQYLQTTGSGVQWASVSSYSAPTIGSTSIGSGATVTTINGMTKLVSATHAQLDANSYEQDITLMTIMGAW
jgi:hypothetical protein